MKPGLIAALAVTTAILCQGAVPSAAPAAKSAKTRIELKDGWYYLNGKKFLLNALGYEPGARPGEHPDKAAVNLPQLEQDLKVIKAAGFNGIRTWQAPKESQMKVIQKSGLKLVCGIWLPPDENFADPKIVQKDLDILRKTLAYTRNYDCIVTYLIMNEPMPDHMHKVGGQATHDLWKQGVALIHEQHPGIPVTISNNADVGEWLDENVFDVYARNAYDYEDGHNFTHGFANAMRMVTETQGGTKPAILTEFGRSVSRACWHPNYGGNTLQIQATSLVKYYRDILDSGATGLCPFYYADGWWKGGEPNLHNDAPEEWFGFFGYKDASDTIGYPRPVWYALTQYNKALVASPKNQQFYQNEVPIELFAQPGVKKLKVVYQDAVLLEAAPDARGYFSGKLSFGQEGLKDRELVFEFYDAKGQLQKWESLVILTGKDPVQWPTLELRSPATTLENAKEVVMDVQVKNDTVFSINPVLRYSFAAHKGWESPEDHTAPLDAKAKDQTFTTKYVVPEASAVLALYAGVDIKYGKFVKTLTAHKYLYRGNWADPLRVK